jgi:hypothetical protein
MMKEGESKWRPGMLVLGAVFAAWSGYSYVTTMDEPDRSLLGVMLLSLAAVFCFLRARRAV